MPGPNAFLRNIPLFADLSDEDLDQVCRRVEEVRLQPGEFLFEEGSIGQHAYIIREGQIEIFKTANSHEVQLAVRGPGEMIGEISLLESSPRNASGRALTGSLLYAIGQEQFDSLLNTSQSAARTMLHTVILRLRSIDLALSQSEKMAQLGTLTAGIAHELNNPASAVQRGAEQFNNLFDRFQEQNLILLELRLSPGQVQSLVELARKPAPTALPGSMDLQDREQTLEEWLERAGVENVWETAPLLAGLCYRPEDLELALAGFSPEALPAAIAWAAGAADLHSLAEEMSQGAGRISEIVKALKTYAYLDQAPVQSVNIHDGLENTLVILRHKLKQGVEVARDFHAGIPPIQAYASELNQVWTNIIDNAVDAMGGRGKITIRTAFQDPWVIVDISDNGPGIPPEIQSRLFSPFFTTKPIGKGTGLGLNISYNIIHRHGGDIKIRSRPGETHFEVWLPLDFHSIRGGEGAPRPPLNPDDVALSEILRRTRTIAVVGISDRPGVPAYTVPEYLQERGYRIIPVNPLLATILGEAAYPDLASIPEPVDLVLVFRASERVLPVVEQASAIGAKTIWMQEGVANEAAARLARQAGMTVVMDNCIRKTHQRLSKQPGGI